MLGGRFGLRLEKRYSFCKVVAPSCPSPRSVAAERSLLHAAEFSVCLPAVWPVSFSDSLRLRRGSPAASLNVSCCRLSAACRFPVQPSS